MAQTVIGIFDNATEAQNAVQQLVSNGFMRNNIDIADRSTTGTNTSTYDNDRDDDSIGGFFRNLFGTDDDADKYSRVARRGCTVTVHAQSEDEADRAADILDDNGAVDVDEKEQQYRSTGTTGITGALTSGTAGVINTGTTTTDTDYNRTTDTDYNRTNSLTDDFTTDRRDDFTRDSGTSIPIIEENLAVGKRETETGGVRVRSRIVERPVEEHLRLREEHVHVERNPVNRPATDADLNAFREGTIELTEHAEVPVVNKEARVVEEITLGKEVTERDEVIRDTVRKTEVDVDNLSTDRTLDRTDNRYTTDTDTDYNNTGSTRILDNDPDRDRDTTL